MIYNLNKQRISLHFNDTLHSPSASAKLTAIIVNFSISHNPAWHFYVFNISTTDCHWNHLLKEPEPDLSEQRRGAATQSCQPAWVWILALSLTFEVATPYLSFVICKMRTIMIIQVKPSDNMPYNDVNWDRVQLAVDPRPPQPLFLNRQWAKCASHLSGWKAGAVHFICELERWRVQYHHPQ